jgi:hypothetical protein
MPIAKQITVWMQNRPGKLAEMAAVLSEKKVNILAFWAGLVGERWAIRLIVDKTAAAKQYLAEKGWEITEQDVLTVSPPNNLAGLAALGRKLEAAVLNIEYGYISPGKRDGNVDLFLAVTDVTAALRALDPGEAATGKGSGGQILRQMAAAAAS